MGDSSERTDPDIAGDRLAALIDELTARNRLLEEKLGSAEAELLAKSEALEKTARALAESESYLLGARKLVHMGSWVWDVRTGRQEWSEDRYRIFGLAPGEIEPCYDLAMSHVHPADRRRVEIAFDEAFKGIRPFDLEYRIVRKDGSIRFLHSICSIVFDDDGQPAIVHGIGKDITDGKFAEDRLRQMSWVMEQSPAAVVITDLNGRIEYVNRKFTSLTGYAPEEVIGHNHRAFLKPGKSLQTFFVKLWNTILTGRVRRGEFQNRNKAGEPYWESVLISPVKDDRGIIRHFVVISEDITEQKTAEERIKASLREKEVLLKEVNHRVKNNLQIVTSLLNLQSSHLHDPGDLEMFRDAQNRLRTMAMIHEMLYKSKDLSRIDAADYIRSLTSSLFRSYGLGDAVALTADAEEISLDIDSMVHLGLIVNELVTNSFKYAFPNGRRGEVCVRLSKADRVITLMVSDNGIGLKAGDRAGKPGSLGLELVESLAGQLNGTIELDTAHGTSFKISFPEPE